MSLWARLRGQGDERSPGGPARSTLLDAYLAQALQFAGGGFPLGGQTLYGDNKSEGIGIGLNAYMSALMQSPPAFGAQLVRSLVLSQVRFAAREYATKEPSTRAADGLHLLRNPWPKSSTAELLTKMEWHAGAAGNAFVYRDRARNRLRVLRPDWTVIALGSESDPDSPVGAIDAEVLGYFYMPNGTLKGGTLLLPEDVAHWAPLPDPLAEERGMSWLTPIVREIEADVMATKHKIRYFELGATPNLVVNGIPATSPTEFEEWVEKLEAGHAGVKNAYRTLYLTSGADATVVGSHLKDIDYKPLQGIGETRISVASRVPAPVLGISEGLAGSSLNAGNFGQARRNMADIWLSPTAASVAASLGQIIDLPPTDELVPDLIEAPFMREDAKDAAEIEGIRAQTIRQYVDGGFTAESAIAAVVAQDPTLLEHTGMFSVQLQTPGAQNGGQDNGN